MQLEFYPTVLGCIGDKCREFVPDGLITLMSEEACKQALEFGLQALNQMNTGMVFIGQCVRWGASI